MVKKIAIVVLIVAVLAGFSVSAIRIIMRGSVRSEKTEEEIKMSELIENATKMGTYSSDIYIRAGESIGAKDLLESALKSPISVGSDLPYVNLSKCNIYFDNGKTKEQILSPGKKKFTIIASFDAANRDYVYYVELEADEAPVTTTAAVTVITSSSVHHTTTVTQKVIYNEKPKKTQAPATKKPSAVVTTAPQPVNSLPSTDIAEETPVTQPPQTDPPQDEPVTQPPTEPEAPPETVAPSDPVPSEHTVENPETEEQQDPQ